MADIIVAIRILGASGDPAAARVGEAIELWRTGNQPLEQALGVGGGLALRPAPGGA